MNAPIAGAPKFLIELHDRITLGGRSYRWLRSTEDGHVLIGEDDQLAQSFTHEDFFKRSQRPDFRFERGYFQPERAATLLRGEFTLSNDCTPREREYMLACQDAVEIALRLLDEGTINRSSANLKKVSSLVHQGMCDLNAQRAQQAYEATAPRNKDGSVRQQRGDGADALKQPKKLSGATILSMVRRYEEANYDFAVLFRRHFRSGNRDRRLSADELLFVQHYAKRYASETRPTKTSVYRDYEGAVRAENVDRAAKGLSMLRRVSRKTFFAEINKISAFAICAGRHGLDAAKRRFAAVTAGLDVTRPLQRVEMDEWCGQVMTLGALVSEIQRMNRAERRRIERLRIWVYVAMDRATRCIVALRFAFNPSAAEAKAALAMVGVDKTSLAVAAGAATPWDMFGGCEQIATDFGASYIAADFRAAVADLRMSILNPVGKQPQLRGASERGHLTLDTQVLAAATGRTFGNVVDRGDYNAAERASLTIGEFLRLIVVWVVDVYHNSPHAGLNGQTPRNAWLQQTKRYGVRPPPDAHTRRSIFGLACERVVGARGVRFAGLHYQSPALQAHRRQVGDKKVKIKVDPLDLGRISVRVDGSWVEAVCTRAQFEGVTLECWLGTCRELRAQYAAEAALTQDVVDEALRRLGTINRDAQLRMQLGPIDPKDHQTRIEAAEKEYLGWSLPDDHQIADDLFAGAIPVTGSGDVATDPDAERGARSEQKAASGRKRAPSKPPAHKSSLTSATIKLTR